MGLGKKLVILCCFACASCALVLIAVAAPALFNLVFSGKPLCLPRWSLKCHDSDCGRYYMWCGSNALLEVPAHQVCYKGALVPAMRRDLHSCPKSDSRNSTSNLNISSSLASCTNCNTHCSGSKVCRCICYTQGQSRVYCGQKYYKNRNVASCCGVNLNACTNAITTVGERLWELLASWLGQFTEISVWFLGSFTFQSPAVRGSCLCDPSGECSNVC